MKYIFLNFQEFLGFKKTQSSKFWVKIDATVSKKKVKYHCNVSFYPILKFLVSKFLIKVSSLRKKYLKIFSRWLRGPKITENSNFELKN